MVKEYSRTKTNQHHNMASHCYFKDHVRVKLEFNQEHRCFPLCVQDTIEFSILQFSVSLSQFSVSTGDHTCW